MGIGRIASFLSSLSPAADSAAAAQPVESTQDQGDRRAEGAAAQQERDRDRQNSGAADVAQQLQAMIAAVRTLNASAASQGAAIAVSVTGNQLHHAVDGLGHLLGALDARAAAAATPLIREAGEVVDAVESGLAGTQASAEQVFRALPAQQALAAKEVSERFQANMRDAVDRVRGVVTAILK